MTRAISVAFAALVATTAIASEPTFHSNMMKYRDSSMRPATGRSGNASIEVLALLGKDGVTSLNVTTPAPAAIEKVQLKIHDQPAGNYTSLAGGSFSQDINGLAAHMPLQVQANVSGADGNRMAVVSADEVVKYRPDLAVNNILAPQHTVPGLPFVVKAVVSELNGDLGARANCVLSSNGNVLDQSTGIWVDAGGSVTCTFAASLDSMGAHALTVSVSGANPGDWDNANNSASANVTVALPLDWYFAGARERTLETHRINDAPWSHSEYRGTEWQQFASIMGSTTIPLDGASLTARVVESSGGESIDDIEWSAMDMKSRSSGSFGGTTYNCFNGWHSNNRQMGGCAYQYADGTAFMNFNAGRDSTAVTYISQGWDSRFSDGNGNTWTYNNEGHYEIGTQKRFGPTVSLNVTLTDGVKTFSAAPTISLEPYSREYGFAYRCFEDDWWPYPMICSQNLVKESGVMGSVEARNSF